MLLRHCCRFWQQRCRFRQQCRSNVRHCRKNRSTCSVRQCCFDIVASMDGLNRHWQLDRYGDELRDVPDITSYVPRERSVSLSSLRHCSSFVILPPVLLLLMPTCLSLQTAAIILSSICWCQSIVLILNGSFLFAPSMSSCLQSSYRVSGPLFIYSAVCFTAAVIALCQVFKSVHCEWQIDLLVYNFASILAAHSKQGVALTGRNTTGPPCSVTVEL